MLVPGSNQCAKAYRAKILRKRWGGLASGTAVAHRKHAELSRGARASRRLVSAKSKQLVVAAIAGGHGSGGHSLHRRADRFFARVVVAATQERESRPDCNQSHRKTYNQTFECRAHE